MPNILDNPLIAQLGALKEDPKDSLISVMKLLGNSHHFSTDIVNQLFYHNGKSERKELIFSETQEDEEDYTSSIDEESIDIEKELDEALVYELNDYIYKLVISTESNSKLKNQLKSLMIKLIESDLYYMYDDLFIPNEYLPIVAEYVNKITEQSEYYKTVIEDIELISPSSRLIDSLETAGNSLLLTPVNDVYAYRVETEEVRSLFLLHRSHFRELVSPSVAELRAKFDIKKQTYQENVSKVLNDVINHFNSEAFIDKFNRLILK